MKQYQYSISQWKGLISGPLCSLLIGLWIISGLFGCASKVQTLKSVDYKSDLSERLWQASQNELRHRGFQLDRVVWRSGLIDTFPLVSRQWFEFWRNDVVSSDAIAESSLHTVRRHVELRILPAEQGQYTMTCQVNVDRLDKVSRSTEAAVRTEDIFSTLSTARVSLWSSGKSKYSRGQEWVPIGRDSALETDILRSIEHRVNSGVTK